MATWRQHSMFALTKSPSASKPRSCSTVDATASENCECEICGGIGFSNGILVASGAMSSV